MTIVAPTAVWILVAALIIAIWFYLTRTLPQWRREPAPLASLRWIRRLALPAAGYAALAATMLATVPLAAARHFYPDVGWGATTLAYLCLVAASIRVLGALTLLPPQPTPPRNPPAGVPQGEDPEGRRRRLAWWFDRRAGTVGLLIAAVLLTHAGLVYVAVDQIGSSDEPMVVQPAQSSQSPRSPISVEADPPARVPAPAATRLTETVETETETPAETGVDLAAERAQPQGVAPPLTGNEPPSSEVRPEPNDPAPADTPADTPADIPADEGTTDPGPERAEPSEAASDASDPHEHQDGSSEPPAEDQDSQHGRHGHGAQDHEPPGQDGDAPGASGDSNGKGNGGS